METQENQVKISADDLVMMQNAILMYQRNLNERQLFHYSASYDNLYEKLEKLYSATLGFAEISYGERFILEIKKESE